MSWVEGWAVLRLLSEEQFGKPAREAEAMREQQSIEEMRRSLADVS